MLHNFPVIPFLATKSPDKAKAFYSEKLGLLLVEDSPFALVFEANRSSIRIQKVKDLTPAAHTALGWEVTNVHDVIRAMQLKGIKFERYPGMQQDELGIWSAPSGAKVAWFKDPDGNVLSLTQKA